jgi:hypothetical protein
VTLTLPTLAALVLAVSAVVWAVSVGRSRFDREITLVPAPAPHDAPGAVARQTAPATPPAPAPEPVAPAEPHAPAPRAAAPGEGPISTIEAANVVDEFRAAYEARDVDRLLGLFAPDASENGRTGLDTIGAAYRSTLGGLEDIQYTLRSLAVDARGSRTAVRAPFLIAYRRPGGQRSEIRGTAEWTLERRDGEPRIVELNYRLEPEPDA